MNIDNIAFCIAIVIVAVFYIDRRVKQPNCVHDWEPEPETWTDAKCTKCGLER